MPLDSVLMEETALFRIEIVSVPMNGWDTDVKMVYI